MSECSQQWWNSQEKVCPKKKVVRSSRLVSGRSLGNLVSTSSNPSIVVNIILIIVASLLSILEQVAPGLHQQIIADDVGEEDPSDTFISTYCEFLVVKTGGSGFGSAVWRGEGVERFQTFSLNYYQCAFFSLQFLGADCRSLFLALNYFY